MRRIAYSERSRAAGRSIWRPALALVLITALAAAFRFWKLDSIPPGFHYDEAYEAGEAWRVITQPGYHPIFFPGNFGVEPMFIYLTALAFRLFGPAPVVMRGVAALAGTLTIPALYALGRELVEADRRIPASMPLLAAAVLAILRWHVHFSRVGIEPVLVPLFLVVILWAFWRASRTGGVGAWLALGAATGLSPYTYPAGRLLPVLVATLALALLAFGPRKPARVSVETSGHGDAEQTGSRSPVRPLTLAPAAGLLLAGVIALLVVAPLALNFVRHPDQLLLRSSQIAVTAPGEARDTPVSNLLGTLGMFSVHGDADPRNNVPGLPVLDLLMAIPFYLGLGSGLWRLASAARSRRPFCWAGLPLASLLLAGLIMLVPTVLSEYAPHFRRALGAAPVTALFAGLGLAEILTFRASLLRPGARAGMVAPRPAFVSRFASYGLPALVAVALLGSGYLSAMNYFVRWGGSADLYYAYDQGLWEIGQYVLSLPPSETVYISPRPASDTTLAFAWREGRSVRHFDARHAFVTTPLGQAATYIIIEHEDFRGLGVLQSLYPDAREAKRFLDRNGQVYAQAFHVESTTQRARRPIYQPAGVGAARWDQPTVELAGYDLDSLAHHPGETFYLQLWWRPLAESALPAGPDWAVFTHLLGPPHPDGSLVWAGADGRPGQGSAPISSWAPGELVLDEYQLQVPADAPPGDYQIEIGFYDQAGSGARGRIGSPANQDHLVLGSVRVQ